MLVRKRKNRSGSITVVVVDKSSGKFRERANFGSSSNPEEINRLVDKARDYILRYDGQQLLDFEGTSKAIEATEAFIGGIESELLNGPQLRIQGHHTTRPATSSSYKPRPIIQCRFCSYACNWRAGVFASAVTTRHNHMPSPASKSPPG